MKRYLKLVNFEVNRIAKVFGLLLAITLVSQVVGVILLTKSYLNKAETEMAQNMLSQATFIEMYGRMSFSQIISSVWFLGPIALCVGAVAFYIFLIWYRDWFGKNTFIYRLLMLPTARLNIFLAKITTILLMTLGFVSFQLIIFPLETMIFRWVVPLDFRIDLGISEIIGTLHQIKVFIPDSFIGFILNYGTGLMIVSVLFTAILFERSYRLKGIAIGGMYSVAAVLQFLSQVLLLDIFQIDYFYSIEVVGLEIITGAIVFIISVWTSKFLLNQKVTV